MQDQICNEFNRLRKMENKELEKIVKHPIPEEHMGKEDSITMHLISKFGYDEVIVSIRKIGFTA